MSNYHALARHPITGEIRVADWLDDSFGHHIYGVRFPGDKAIYPSAQCNEVSLHEAGVEIERLRYALRLLIEWHDDTGAVMLPVLIDAARAALAGEKTND